MNIAFVNSTRKWGGVKSWTLDVAHGLSAMGHRCVIMARPGAFTENARRNNLDTVDVHFGPDFNPLVIHRFLHYFRTQKIDIAVVNVGKDMRSAGIAATLLRIPVVHRVGLAGDMLNTYKVRLLHKWIKPALLVPCHQIKQGLLRELPYLSENEITVIHTGKNPAPQPQTAVHTPLRFISTSQLNADKGHKDVLEALAGLKKLGYDFYYDIVGTGRIETELKALASRLDLDDRIVWHGFQKDVRSTLRKSDIFLLPSYSEGLPNTLLEAMAEGLACVARDTGGVNEVWPRQAQRLLLPASSGSQQVATILKSLLETEVEDILALGQIFWNAANENSLRIMSDKIDFFFQARGACR